MKFIPSNTTWLVLFISSLIAFNSHALVKKHTKKALKIQSLNRVTCEKFLKDKEQRKPDYKTAQAGFVYHNRDGVNSRRFKEFACGMKTATVSLSTIFSIILVFLFLSLIALLAVFYKKRHLLNKDHFKNQ